MCPKTCVLARPCRTQAKNGSFGRNFQATSKQQSVHMKGAGLQNQASLANGLPAFPYLNDDPATELAHFDAEKERLRHLRMRSYSFHQTKAGPVMVCVCVCVCVLLLATCTAPFYPLGSSLLEACPGFYQDIPPPTF